MSLNANDRESGNFTPIPALEAGSYPGRVVVIATMGVQGGQSYQGQPKPPQEQLYIAYEFSHEFLKDEEGNDDVAKPRWIGENFNFFSLDSERAKSTLRYNALDPTGAANGDWRLLGAAPCSITLTKEPRKKGPGETNYVSNIAPLANMPGYVQPELVNPVRIFDFEEPDLDVFKTLPQWLQEKIKGAEDYEGSALQIALGEKPREAATPTAAPAQPAAPAMPAPPAMPDAG